MSHQPSSKDEPIVEIVDAPESFLTGNPEDTELVEQLHVASQQPSKGAERSVEDVINELRPVIRDYREMPIEPNVWIHKTAVEEALQTERQKRVGAVEEALRNVPVGFVRQWINEDLLKEGHRQVTNEDIQRFINIALQGKS